MRLQGINPDFKTLYLRKQSRLVRSLRKRNLFKTFYLMREIRKNNRYHQGVKFLLHFFLKCVYFFHFFIHTIRKVRRKSKNMNKKIAGKMVLGVLILIMLLGIIWRVNLIYGDRIITTLNDNSYDGLVAPKREIASTTEGEKICYLTFDDGPSKNTLKILDILKQYEVKATFFVIGNCICENNRNILERIVEEGHAIGLHANNHVYEKFYANETSFLKDYEMLYQTLKNDYGITTALFRLPGGSACKYMYGKGSEYVGKMRERGFSCFDWNVTGEDSVGTPTVYSIQKNVFERVFRYERPIVLLHDSSIADMTVQALPGMIEKIRENGYDFETLEHREEYVFPNKK